ncbi:MAG: CvpA family protein [Patescibacteria group bacterium]
MLIYEILAIVVILTFVANGIKAGSIETLGRVLGAVIGFLAARAYVGWLVGITTFVVPKEWAFLVSFLVIFLIVDTAIGMLFRIAEGLLKIFTRLPILKQINGFLGGVFGLLEAIVVVGGVSWLLQRSTTPGSITFLNHIQVVNATSAVFQKLFGMLL